MTRCPRMDKLFRMAMCIFFYTSFVSTAQDAENISKPVMPTPYMHLGVIAGYSFINNNTTLLIFSNLPTCGTFTDGKAKGLLGGLTVEYPILDFVDISTRVLYSHRPASLTSQYDCGLTALDPVTKQYVPYLRNHVFTANLRYLVVDAGLRIMPFNIFDIDIPVYVRASADVGDPVVGNTYTQTEEVLQPSSVLFPDGTKKHEVGYGSLQDAGTSYGVTGTIGYDIRIGKKLSVCLEGGYRKGLNSVVKNQDWKLDAFYAALNLRYALMDDIPPPPEVPPPPPLKPEPIPVVVKAPDPLVIESFNTSPLEVQETIVTETYPLLPYIFYDSTSSILRERYTPEVNPKAFNETMLDKQTLTIYYNMLNIIGARMVQNPTSRITITGTTDGRELPTYSQRKKLADERAKTIADYLTKTWSIGPERISQASNDQPALFSNPLYIEGLEENRRVEITSNDAAILAPVVHSRFMEYAPIQNKQVFSVKALRPELARGWDASIIYLGRPIARLSSDSLLPQKIPFALDSAVMINLGKEIAIKDKLDGKLSVLQNDGSTVTANTSFPIIKTLNKFEISRLSLIVFDFDRSDIAGANKTMMEKFAQEAITTESHVTITGSTDRLGEAEHNKTLSQSRADAAKQLLIELKSGTFVDEANGIGASQLKYNNNLPEGRYYCRTVTIMVKTPIKK